MATDNLSILKLTTQAGRVLVTILLALSVPSFANAQAQSKSVELSLLDSQPKPSKSATPAAASLIPVKPAVKRNHDRLFFFGWSAAHVVTTEWVNYARHNGARECQAEDNRLHVSKMFNKPTTMGLNTGRYVFGQYPHFQEVLIPTSVIQATGIVLYLTHHHKLADRFLSTFVAGEAGVGGAIMASGCN